MPPITLGICRLIVLCVTLITGAHVLKVLRQLEWEQTTLPDVAGSSDNFLPF